MQSDLNSLSNWLQLNKLKLNVKKTKCMLLHKEGLFPNVGLEVDGQSIEQVSTFKFLGVTLDNSLTFSAHYTEL